MSNDRAWPHEDPEDALAVPPRWSRHLRGSERKHPNLWCATSSGAGTQVPVNDQRRCGGSTTSPYPLQRASVSLSSNRTYRSAGSYSAAATATVLVSAS